MDMYFLMSYSNIFRDKTLYILESEYVRVTVCCISLYVREDVWKRR